jgi:hypothetical protein
MLFATVGHPFRFIELIFQANYTALAISMKLLVSINYSTGSTGGINDTEELAWQLGVLSVLIETFLMVSLWSVKACLIILYLRIV